MASILGAPMPMRWVLASAVAATALRWLASPDGFPRRAGEVRFMGAEVPVTVDGGFLHPLEVRLGETGFRVSHRRDAARRGVIEAWELAPAHARPRRVVIWQTAVDASRWDRFTASLPASARAARYSNYREISPVAGSNAFIAVFDGGGYGLLGGFLRLRATSNGCGEDIK